MRKRTYGSGSLRVVRGSWTVRWYTDEPDGSRRQWERTVGPARPPHRDGLTEKQAAARVPEVMAGAAEERAKADTGVTVKQLGERHLADLRLRGKKPSHIETATYHLSKHIDPLLGPLDAAGLVEHDVRRLVERMTRESKAPKTIRNVIGTLHSVMELAVEDHLIERNPVSMKKLPDVRRSKDIHFLTPAELQRLLAAAPGDDESIRTTFPVGSKYGGPGAVRDWWPVVRMTILAAALTGMRLGELRGLRWIDLDMRAVKVRVRQSFVRGQMGTPKSDGSSRAIPLASWLMEELNAHHKGTVWNQDSDLVLAHPHTGRPLDRVRLGYHFKAALKRADVRPVRIHDLRHTFATTVAASGEVSIRTLQEWLGHEDLRTTQIYADYMPGEREQELVDAAFPVPHSSLNLRNTTHPEPLETPVNNA